jgi:enoyl-CoA hydratase/3-hydroxyacyl-CoA dehydrogenase
VRALWHARVAGDPRSRAPLSGIIPGFGGTARLPRLVGLEKGLTMMLRSKNIKADEGAKSGLIDVVVPTAAEVLPAAKALALDIARGAKPKVQALKKGDKLPNMMAINFILMSAREEAGKVAKHMTHPLGCIDAVEAGVIRGGLAGIKKEGEVFKVCVQSPASKALVHMFFATRNTANIRGVTDKGLKPRRIAAVGVVGGGLMGAGIATACILNGIHVLLKEVNQTFLDAGMGRVRSNVESVAKKKKMAPDAVAAILGRVRGTLDYNEFGKLDMVIEAVIEDLGLKQRIFADLERACNKDCILSTNTSTIDITKVAANVGCPERVLGAHFFSPAHVMQLFEIVRTPKTSAQAIVDTLGFSKQIKKMPVVVGNCTGFAVNRVFFPYTMAACMLVDLGLDPYHIDAVIAKQFGMPMGPFRLSDLVGADVGAHVGANVVETWPERVYRTALIPSLVAAKRLGEKTGAGFYKFDAKRKASPDPEGLAPLLAASRAACKLPRPSAAMSDADIMEFIFFPVVNEAARVIDEGIVSKPSDLDVAAVLGMGFPPFRGGVVKWADQVGAQRIAQRLTEWSKAYGAFFAPCDFLLKAAKEGRQLGAGAPKAKM